MLAALLATLSDSGSLVLDKITLTRHRLPLGVFLPIVFVVIALITWLLTPWLGHINWQVATLSNELFLLFMMIIIAIAGNVLYYQSVQHEKVHHTELLMMFAPLITIILAAIFYPDQLNIRVFILAIIASLALIFSKSTKEHFFTGRVAYNTFLAVILMSTETIIIRELLYIYSPVALYAVRTLALAIFFWLYYRPHAEQLRHKYYPAVIASAILSVIAMLARFYALTELGIVYTTLIMIIGPIIVFLASKEILHEKIRVRMVIASLIILACVAMATVIQVGS